MKKWNYYNDIDTNVCEWAKELIKAGIVPAGEVDNRSIEDIDPSDLRDFTQCHFFCGLLGWPLALKLAGWPEDRPVWTASLPCQPFSSAGKQRGTDDERHLWPVFERLVRECRPPTILGEQVSSKVARNDWFTGVCLDLEALGYAAFGSDICAPCAGEVGEGRIVRGDQETWEPIILGAPHIRQRLYWVACRMGNADPNGEQRQQGLQPHEGGETERIGGSGEPEWLGDSHSERREEHGRPSQLHLEQRQGADTNGLGFDSGVLGYSTCVGLQCADGKARRFEPGIFPLAHGLPRGVVPSGDPSEQSYANATGEARVMRLKGYGNAINAPLAAMFISTCMEVIPHE